MRTLAAWFAAALVIVPGVALADPCDAAACCFVHFADDMDGCTASYGEARGQNEAVRVTALETCLSGASVMLEGCLECIGDRCSEIPNPAPIGYPVVLNNGRPLYTRVGVERIADTYRTTIELAADLAGPYRLTLFNGISKTSGHARASAEVVVNGARVVSDAAFNADTRVLGIDIELAAGPNTFEIRMWQDDHQEPWSTITATLSKM